MIASLRALIFSLFLLGSLVGASPTGSYGHGGKKHHGQTREYNFDLTWEDHAPDGYSRKMMLVNGQSPGPVIKVEQDDWVVVKVNNLSPHNTTLHFHGIEMLGTPFSDGVPGVTQNPILPGGCFTYKWKATQYGSYWYHAHFHGQIEDGFYGPIVIDPRPHDPKPFHLISNESCQIEAMIKAEKSVVPLSIADFTHLTSEEKWDLSLAAGLEDSCYDSILFNGKGRVQCLPKSDVEANLSAEQKQYLALVPGSSMTDKSCFPAELLLAIGGGGGNVSAIPHGVFSGCTPTDGDTEVIQAAEDAEWIAIDIIGAINFATGVVSIDEHDMWVYSMDGAYITPQKVQGIVVTNGDRYSVLVKLTKKGNFKIRFNAVSAPQLLVGNAILSVGGYGTTSDSTPYVSIAGVPLSKDVVYFNQNIAFPYPPDPIPQKADALFKLNMKIDGASYLWAMNSSRLMPTELDMQHPTLFNPMPYVENNVTITTKYNTWVDLVFFASVSPQPPHPIHKHGTKMYQIGAGTGDFNWTSVEDAMKEIPDQFNLVNPPRRDAFTSPPAIESVSWTVVRYHVSNPGAWLLHCHINNHMLGGMMMVIQDGVDNWPKVPKEYKEGGNGEGYGK